MGERTDYYADIEGELVVEPPQEYKVILIGESEPEGQFTTFGGWSIEGDFLCVYSQEGLKVAHRIYPTTLVIETVEVDHNGKHEAKGSDSAE